MLNNYIKPSVNLYSGALFIEHAMDWNLYVAVGLILLLTALTTITGGLTAVIYTDTLQTVIMLSGAAVVAAKALLKIGGWRGEDIKCILRNSIQHSSLRK